MPKVSICIPAYENAEGIQKLLRSIEEQTYTDFEVIVSDDSRTGAVEQAVRAEAACRMAKSQMEHRMEQHLMLLLPPAMIWLMQNRTMASRETPAILPACH